MHCMVDLETLDVEPTAHILSIGAVMFNREQVVDAFYQIIDIDDFMIDKFTISAGTLKWWLKQHEAIKEFSKLGLPLPVVLANFSNWFKINDGKEMWGNGATFDNVILKNAYKVVSGVKIPWSYKDDCCYRTIVNKFPKIDLEFQGTRHNALADAQYQAEYLIKLNKEYVLNIL